MRDTSSRWPCVSVFNKRPQLSCLLFTSELNFTLKNSFCELFDTVPFALDHARKQSWISATLIWLILGLQLLTLATVAKAVNIFQGVVLFLLRFLFLIDCDVHVFSVSSAFASCELSRGNWIGPFCLLLSHQQVFLELRIRTAGTRPASICDGPVLVTFLYFFFNF